MNLKRKGIKDIFTKLGKEGFDIWFSGVRGEGEFKIWRDNGQVWQLAFWKDNKQDGEYKSWHRGGQIFIHAFYKNGELEGEYKRWRDNGQLLAHAFYKNGKVAKKIKWT